MRSSITRAACARAKSKGLPIRVASCRKAARYPPSRLGLNDPQRARDLDLTGVCRAPLLPAHPNRGRMARQLETFAGVRDGRAIDLEDGYVLVEIVADQQIVSVGRERRPFRHAADLDVADMGHLFVF